MKRCTWCRKEYPDHLTDCPLKEEPAVLCEVQPSPGARVMPDKAWERQVVGYSGAIRRR